MPLPDITHTPAYRNAFQLYLRKGVPIELSMKAAAAQEHPTTHYIWRTRGDNKVRAAHAANNGSIKALTLKGTLKGILKGTLPFNALNAPDNLTLPA